MHDTVMLDPAGTLSENCPSALVTAPMEELPATMTVAPMTGKPLPSTTIPFMGRFCANESVPARQMADVRTKAATFLKYLLVIN